MSEGIDNPEAMLRQYVVTPELAGCFDNALGFIKSALETRPYDDQARVLRDEVMRYPPPLGDRLAEREGRLGFEPPGIAAFVVREHGHEEPRVGHPEGRNDPN